MATSGTYAFNPSLGELVLFSYSLCGIRRVRLVQEHMVDARMAANLILVDWANDGPALFTVELESQVLTPEVATYNIDASTIMVLDAYIETGDDPPISRIIPPVSRTEYASFPNKETPGFPTVFWFDRLIAPTITLWQPPDDSQTYTLKYYRFRQMQDANYTPGGLNVELPYRYLSAFAYGLAAKLSLIYAPDRTAMLEPEYVKTYERARTQDTENVSLHITPGLSSYYR